MSWVLFLKVLQAWWKAGVGVIIGLILAYPLGQCSGARREHRLEEAQRAVAIAEALKKDEAIKELTAAQRTADAEAVATKKQELTNELAKMPDEAPTQRDVALACGRLRQQGTDVSDLSACSGPKGSAQTPAPR